MISRFSHCKQTCSVERHLSITFSYGYPGNLEHEIVKDACKKVIDICKQNNKSCGTQITDISSQNISEKINQGYNFIILSSDLFVLWKWAEDINKTIKEVKIG